MSRYNDNIFTIYDLMEKAGMFRSNPANIDSIDKATRVSLYKGPVQFPKMLYHPKGETRITVPAEIISTPFGAKMVGEQKELISKIVESAEEEAVLKHLGWHDHPAKAIHAGGGEAPSISSSEQIASLESEMAALKKQLQEALENRGEQKAQTEEQKADKALATAMKTIKAA